MKKVNVFVLTNDRDEFVTLRWQGLPFVGRLLAIEESDEPQFTNPQAFQMLDDMYHQAVVVSKIELRVAEVKLLPRQTVKK